MTALAWIALGAVVVGSTFIGFLVFAGAAYGAGRRNGRCEMAELVVSELEPVLAETAALKETAQALSARAAEVSRWN